MNKLLTISTTVPPHCNGGEDLIIKTDIIENGDGIEGIILNQQISLQSYGNSVTLNLYGNVLTPDFLRYLAQEIEYGIAQAKDKIIDNNWQMKIGNQV